MRISFNEWMLFHVAPSPAPLAKFALTQVKQFLREDAELDEEELQFKARFWQLGESVMLHEWLNSILKL